MGRFIAHGCFQLEGVMEPTGPRQTAAARSLVHGAAEAQELDSAANDVEVFRSRGQVLSRRALGSLVTGNAGCKHGVLDLKRS